MHVVTVGGGYAGVRCALECRARGIPYKLVDPKAYFHHAVAALRASVTAGTGENTY